MKSSRYGIVALAFVAAQAHAQVRFETGGGAAHLDQLPATSLTAIGGGVDALFGLASFHFNGTSEDHIGVGVAGAMTGTLHVNVNAAGWHLEAGPSAQAARDIGSPWASDRAGDVSAERDIGRLTVHGGLQLGVAQVGNQHSTWNRTDLNATFRLGKFALGGTWQSAALRDSALQQTFFSDTGSAVADTIFRARARDIRDVGVRMQWSSGLLSMGAHVVRRFGTGVSAQTWWEGTASLRITPVMALTMKSGQLASDPVLGLRGGQYTTLGLRVDLLQKVPPREKSDRTALALIEREKPDLVRLTFTLPAGVRQAALTGDLTDWRPVNLARTEDGRWEIVLGAKAGVHRINLSTDNGAWLPPPGIPATDDGFGSKVGLLVLEK